MFKNYAIFLFTVIFLFLMIEQFNVAQVIQYRKNKSFLPKQAVQINFDNFNNFNNFDRDFVLSILSVEPFFLRPQRKL